MLLVGVIFPIPAASSKSERVFSVAGRIVTPDRNRLAPELVEDLVTMKCNLRLLRNLPSVWAFHMCHLDQPELYLSIEKLTTYCLRSSSRKYIYPLLLNQVFKNSREFNFHWEDGTPKSVMKHVSWAVGLVRIFPHLYCRRGSHFHQDHLEICAKWTKLIFISLEDWFHISQRWFEPILPLLCWTEL